MLNVVTILLFGFALVSGPAIGTLLLNRKLGWVFVPLALLFLLAAGQAFLIFFSTGTFFVAAVTCLPLPAGFITLLYLLYWRGKNEEILQSETPVRRMFWLTMILISIILITPFFDLVILRSACFSLNKRAAAPIITAMEEYHQEYGDYPEHISSLSPDYLDSIPQGRCQPLPGSSLTKPTFNIEKCIHEDTTILTIPITSGEWIQRYHPETGQWATLSFLDGACSYLDR